MKKSVPLILLAALVLLIGCNRTDESVIIGERAAWSPDGSTIAYRSLPYSTNDTAGIWLVDTDGTNDRYLCSGISADWSPDGERLVIATLGYCIYLIDKDGSNFEWLIRDGESNSPAWSPDGRWIAFTRPYAGGGYRINLETREEKEIIGVPAVDWAPDSRHVIHYWRAGNRKPDQAIKITDTQELESWTVREFNAYDDGALDGIPHWSPDGDKILFMMDLHTWVIDTNGENLECLAEYAAYPNWSPDGERIVFTKCDEDGELWVMDSDGKNQRPLRDK